MNGDGAADLVVANKGGPTVSIFLGDGLGAFSPAVDYPAGPSPQYVALADLNGDGLLDVVVANYYNNSLKAMKRMNTMMTKLALVRPKRAAK